MGKNSLVPTAKRRSNACEQIWELKWLCKIIMRPGLKGLSLVLLTVANRPHQDHRLRGQLFDFLTGFDSIYARHFDVEEHYIIMVGAKQCQRLLAGTGFLSFKAERSQCYTECAAERRFIVNNEDLTLRVVFSIRSSALRTRPGPIRRGEISKKAYRRRQSREKVAVWFT